MRKRTEVIRRLSYHLPQHTVLGLVDALVISKARYLLELYHDTLGIEHGATKDFGGTLYRLEMRQNAALRAAMRISPKEHRGTEYLCQKAGMPTMRDVAVQAAVTLAFRTMAPGGDLGDLTSSRLKLHVFTRQTRAATSGEIQQETE
jgi:hypothetical protein